MQYKLDNGIDMYDLETHHTEVTVMDDDGSESSIRITMEEMFPDIINYIHWLETK
jgi:hypothetical protein